MIQNSSRTMPNSCLTAVIVLMATYAWSATGYNVLHNFTGAQSGPTSGLTADSTGNVYGTTWSGSFSAGGTVYELSPTMGYKVIYNFSVNGTTGFAPQGKLAPDSLGNLYGTTQYGGNTGNACIIATCGVVFELSPPSNGSGQWTETVLYSFCSQANCRDGANPQSGVVFGSDGNLYGTTYVGGNCPSGVCGVVFKLSPPSNGGPWTESVLYSFCSQASCADGQKPFGGLIFDTTGNLYGTTTGGGSGGGVVFELSSSGGSWAETVIHTFSVQNGDGIIPYGGLAVDAFGTLYGTASAGGNAPACQDSGCGVVFQLTETGGIWAETVIHTFTGRDGASPYASVILDSSGNVYGTTRFGGNTGSNCSSTGCGTVFELVPSAGGKWTESVLRIPNENSGFGPMAPLVMDSLGNVYGTTSGGGQLKSKGVAFSVSP